MATTRTPRRRWIDEGLQALADGGPDAVRIESLARAIGVTKGGFYWHFEDRSALLDEVLDTWERVIIDEVIDLVEGEGGDAGTRLQRLFAIASVVPSTRVMLKVDVAVRDWARRDEAVADRLRRVDGRRMAYLRSLFGDLFVDEDEVEARCTLALSLFVGFHFIAVDHGGRSRAEVLALALRQLQV